MRRAVVRQMKKPMQNNTTNPMRDPIDMLSLMMTDIGRTKIDMSVRRLRMAFDQLLECQFRREILRVSPWR